MVQELQDEAAGEAEEQRLKEQRAQQVCWAFYTQHSPPSHTTAYDHHLNQVMSRRKKKSTASFGQPTRLITCANHVNNNRETPLYMHVWFVQLNVEIPAVWVLGR